MFYARSMFRSTAAVRALHLRKENDDSFLAVKSTKDRSVWTTFEKIRVQSLSASKAAHRLSSPIYLWWQAAVSRLRAPSDVLLENVANLDLNDPFIQHTKVP